MAWVSTVSYKNGVFFFQILYSCTHTIETAPGDQQLLRYTYVRH